MKPILLDIECLIAVCIRRAEMEIAREHNSADDCKSIRTDENQQKADTQTEN